jgi:hypothetical protein
MSTLEQNHERDFSTFHLGDNPNELADRLMYGVFDHFGIIVDPYDNIPSVEEYDQLIQALGTKKTLRENKPKVSWTMDQMADLVVDSGIQQSLNRSLWTPEIATPDSADRFAMGAVANQQDRIATVLSDNVGDGRLWLPAGNRVMNTATEAGLDGLKPNPNVQSFYNENYDQEGKNRYPTEAEYAERFVVPRVVKAGYDKDEVHFEAPSTNKGDEILLNFVNEHPNVTRFGRQLAVARVANSGVMLALQMRKAAHVVRPTFDRDPKHPQLFILNDFLRVARTEEQANDPVHFQKPEMALRQLAVTGKLLAEAYGDVRYAKLMD